MLRHLPIDLVKIDGGFVTDLRHSPFDQIAVRSTVDMCRALGIRTAAEYVPDTETADLLREYGVDFAQGYAIGRPVPMASAAAGFRADTPGSFLGRAIG
jgi:EAL domain-containing protein (putative c-di-GMP-specific phosphodiesterase class I)